MVPRDDDAAVRRAGLRRREGELPFGWNYLFFFLRAWPASKRQLSELLDFKRLENDRLPCKCFVHVLIVIRLFLVYYIMF